MRVGGVLIRWTSLAAPHISGGRRRGSAEHGRDRENRLVLIDANLDLDALVQGEVQVSYGCGSATFS